MQHADTDSNTKSNSNTNTNSNSNTHCVSIIALCEWIFSFALWEQLHRMKPQL